MLVRRYLNASFMLLARSGWDDSVCAEFSAMLTARGCPLWCVRLILRFISFSLNRSYSPDDTKVPSSLAYHLSDIFLEELEKVMSQVCIANCLKIPVVLIRRS